MLRYRTVGAGGHRVFYREAGDPANPTLLLHGFPTSSHMFRDLIPLLADQFHLVAPDLPGFGHTTSPAEFAYTFDNLAEVIAGFTDSVGLTRYALYVFDYGAPTGFRLAMARPDRVTAIVSQNGNAYEEGLSENWGSIQRYWREPTPANREALRSMLTLEATRWQYTHGVPDESLVSPGGYSLDQLFLDRGGNDEVQLDLFRDYVTNVALYPRFQAYFRESRPPLLAVWGKNDPFFLPAGAEAYRRDNPNAEFRLLGTGHFALETHAHEVAAAIREFLAAGHRRVIRRGPGRPSTRRMSGATVTPAAPALRRRPEEADVWLGPASSMVCIAPVQRRRAARPARGDAPADQSRRYGRYNASSE